jgi:cytidyltransferase-like protein
MQIVRGLESSPPDAGPSAVALGAFDGIHLGHRAILGTAVALARQGKIRALACTFDRHPMEVLQPDRAPMPITTLEERLELIAGTGIDTTVVIPFTPAVASVEAKASSRTSSSARSRPGKSSWGSITGSAAALAATLSSSRASPLRSGFALTSCRRSWSTASPSRHRRSARHSSAEIS